MVEKQEVDLNALRDRMRKGEKVEPPTRTETPDESGDEGSQGGPSLADIRAAAAKLRSE